jgi:AcrR family transcriptional regulator
VPMAEIAAEAGVGVGTLYRNFPNREDLLAELTVRSLGGVLERAQRAAGRDGPAIEAVRQFFTETIAAREELVLPLHGVPAPDDARIIATRDALRRTLHTILERGRDDGSIRSDATAFDIVLAGATLAEPLANIGDWDRHARRLARIILDGLRPPAAGDPA